MGPIDKLVVGIVFIVLLCLGAYRWGYGNGEDTLQAEWDKDRAALLAANDRLIEKHAREIVQTVAFYNKTNLDNTVKHETALKEVTDALAAARAESRRLGGLRIPAPACQSTAADAQTTGTGERNAGTTTTIALPEPIEDGLWSIVGHADQVTEQLRSCQGWIKANGFYGE